MINLSNIVILFLTALFSQGFVRGIREIFLVRKALYGLKYKNIKISDFDELALLEKERSYSLCKKEDLIMILPYIVIVFSIQIILIGTYSQWLSVIYFILIMLLYVISKVIYEYYLWKYVDFLTASLILKDKTK